MSRRMLVPSIAVTLLLGLVAGCGDDDKSSGSGTPLSKDAYVAELRATLAPLGAKSAALQSQIQSSTSADDLSSNLADAEAEFQSVIDDLEAIEPPADAADAHGDLVVAIDKFRVAVADVKDAAASGDNQEILASAQALALSAPQLQTDLEAVRSALSDVGIKVTG